MKKNSSRDLAWPIAVAAAAIGLVPAERASAQTQLDEVIVTAQKRAEALADVPLAVQAFSTAQLEQAGVRDLAELINFVPGASTGRTLTAGARSYQIRGVSSYYGDSTVGYYLDEAVFSVLNRNFAPVARTFDVERVEVLRGPQGTLYGQGAMGGTIRFITADPDLQQFRLRGDTGWSDTDGGDSNHFGELAVSVPLVRDRLALRAAASYEHLGGFAESPTFPGEKNVGTAETYRAKLLAKPTDALTVKLMYQRVESSDDWGAQFAAADPPSFFPSTLQGAPVFSKNTTEYDLSTLFLSWDAGPVVVESATGYIDRSAAGNVPLNLGTGAPLLPGAPLPQLSTVGESDMLSSELRVISKSDGPFHWIAGAIYQDGKSREDVLVRATHLNFPPPFPPLPPTLMFRLRDESSLYESQSYAVFGEISWDLMGGRLVPLLGLRYFEDDRSFHTTTFNPPGPPPLATAARVPRTFATDATFDSLNPRFNLSYELTDGTMLYLNVAKGFRSGTFNTQQAVTAAIAGQPAGPGGVPPAIVPIPDASLAVDPDEIWSYEVGTKASLLGGRLQLEAAVYYFDWTDMQLNFSVAQQQQLVANAGDATGKGLDYGLTWLTPLDGLRLQLTGNFNQTEFDEVKNPSRFAGTGVVQGRQVASVPEQTHTFAASYDRALSGEALGLSLYAGYSYSSRQGDTTYFLLGEPQQLLTLRAGLHGRHWAARLVGENLLDEKDPIQRSGSGVMRTYPRTLGLELSVDF